MTPDKPQPAPPPVNDPRFIDLMYQALQGAPSPPPTKPIGGLSDKRFKYVPACKTNIRETFKRIREERAKGGKL